MIKCEKTHYGFLYQHLELNKDLNAFNHVVGWVKFMNFSNEAKRHLLDVLYHG